MHDTSAPHFARMLRKLDAILARTIAFVESLAAATARRGLKAGVGGTAIPLVRSCRPATGPRLMGSRPSDSLAAGLRQAAG